MQLGPVDSIWTVTDPAPEDGLGDCCFETCLRESDHRFSGDGNPVLFTDRCEAEREARSRLLARDVARGIADGELALPCAARVQVVDEDGDVLYSVEVENGRTVVACGRER
jgi:hypothetical protein